MDEILIPTMKQMVEEYQVHTHAHQLNTNAHTFICHMQPEVIWADGAGDSPCTHDSIKYWKAPEFLSWLYNESPVSMTAVVNSRCVMNWAAPVEITVIEWCTYSGGELLQLGTILLDPTGLGAHTTHTHSCMQLHTMLHFAFSIVRFTPGHLVPYKWESCFTIQETSWGYDRTVSEAYIFSPFYIHCG